VAVCVAAAPPYALALTGAVVPDGVAYCQKSTVPSEGSSERRVAGHTSEGDLLCEMSCDL